MDNYPPGVTGNEPQITGEWPCTICDGRGFEVDEDGKYSCNFCNGTGIFPEEAIELREIEELLKEFFKKNNLGFIDVECNSDNYVTIYTNLMVFGDYAIKE